MKCYFLNNYNSNIKNIINLDLYKYCMLYEIDYYYKGPPFLTVNF